MLREDGLVQLEDLVRRIQRIQELKSEVGRLPKCELRTRAEALIMALETGGDTEELSSGHTWSLAHVIQGKTSYLLFVNKDKELCLQPSSLGGFVVLDRNLVPTKTILPRIDKDTPIERLSGT